MLSSPERMEAREAGLLAAFYPSDERLEGLIQTAEHILAAGEVGQSEQPFGAHRLRRDYRFGDKPGLVRDKLAKSSRSSVLPGLDGSFVHISVCCQQMRAFLALLKKVLRRGEQELRFVFRVRSLDAETDRRLYSIALNLEKPLRSRIESTFSSERVRLTRIEIRPGSVELRIMFLAAYEFVAKHEDLERNSSQMIEKISTVIKAIFSEAGIHDLSFVSPLSEG